MPIQPISGVEAIHGQRFCWRATDDDPQFGLSFLRSFAGQWVYFTAEVDSEDRGAINPIIYFDNGQGYSSKNTIRLPSPRGEGAGIQYVFKFPPRTTRIRFDPIEARGEFHLTAPCIRRLGPAGAGWAILRELAQRLGRRKLLKSAARAIFTLPTPRGLRDYIRQLAAQYQQEMLRTRPSYEDWIARSEPASSTYPVLIAAQAAWPKRPLISIVMPVYNPPLAVLRAALDSVKAQLYPDWELCIADDASPNTDVGSILREFSQNDDRIKLVQRRTNGHIVAASNSALEVATGDFIALMDHDDLLHPLALHYVADAIVKNSDAELIFSDEDKVDERGNRFDPYFKCDFNYELMLAHNMISHLGVYRRSLVQGLGGFRSGTEGSQDYDLALRALEKLTPAQVIHIPRVLYHWRAIAGSTALASDEKPYAVQVARRVVFEHLARRGIAAEVLPAPEAPSMNRVRFPVPDIAPLVSIIIPTRDRADLLAMCIDSVLKKTTYPNFEVIVVDNGSVEAATRDLFSRLPADRVRVIRDDSPFNYSALNNRAVLEARGALVCLLNNDIEIMTPGWLEEMVSFAHRDDIGCVGARLWYPDGRLQHGGVVTGVGGIANHAHRLLPRGAPGYFGRAVLHQSFSAVTAACLVVRASVYRELGGLDEALQVAFNDVDFCLRVRQAGYRNVWTPFAEMIHHESASRGQETTPEKRQRFEGETQYMLNRWGDALLHDPAYSQNLTFDAEDFSIGSFPRS